MTATAHKPKAKPPTKPPAKKIAAAAPNDPPRVPVNDRMQAELQIIAAKNGGVLPAGAVVEWARAHPKSELHKKFTWDNSDAADKWRLQQARVLIATVTIEPREDVTVRAWVNLPSDRAGDRPAYRPTVRVMSNTEHREELLAMVKDELGRMRRKYADLTELASVWSAIDQTARAS